MITLMSQAATLPIQTYRGGEGSHRVVDEVSRTAVPVDPRLGQVDRLLDGLAAPGVCLAGVLDTHAPRSATPPPAVGGVACTAGGTVASSCAAPRDPWS